MGDTVNSFDLDEEAHIVRASGSKDHTVKNWPLGARSGSLGGTDLVSAVVTVVDVRGGCNAYGTLTLSTHLLTGLKDDVVDSVVNTGVYHDA